MMKNAFLTLNKAWFKANGFIEELFHKTNGQVN